MVKNNLKLKNNKKYINRKLLFNVYTCMIKDYKKNCFEIEITFMNDNEISLINNKLLNHNYATDIITQNYNDDKSICSEMYISYETIKNNAKIYNTSVKNEVLRVCIHGMVHLLGFEDKSDIDAIKMKDIENYYLTLQ